jgi:hypothetical protein
MSVEYGSLRLSLKTLYSKFFAKADLKRWQNLQNFEVEWSARTRLMANLIPPHSRVIEFGAGRRQMESLLDQSCTYIPSDLVGRGPGTFICDLNVRPLPDLTPLNPDAAVFGGVLEYISDLRSIPRWLAKHIAICIVSYECAYSQPETIGRLRESFSRIRNGWVNTYSEAEVEALFAASEFTCVDKVTWSTKTGDELIFVFQNHSRSQRVAPPDQSGTKASGMTVGINGCNQQ